MKNGSVIAPAVATTSATLNDKQAQQVKSTENASLRSAALGLKPSRSGFPLAKPAALGRGAERVGSAFQPTATAFTPQGGPIAGRPAPALSAPAAKLKPAPRAINPAHVKSVQKAAKAFKNFSLSKFAKDKVPDNYIAPRHVHDPKAVQDAQRQLISRQLRELPDPDPRNRGVTITFPVAELEAVRKALPGMSEHGGEVTLDDLLTYLCDRMNGRSFYSSGNTVMKRLTAAMQARSQARAIIERVKNGSREKRLRPPQKGALPTAAVSMTSRDAQGPERKGGSRP